MQPHESSSTERSSTAPALAVGIPAILVLALLPFLQVGEGAGLPRLFLFFGRLHPLVLHLPVAFLLLALFLRLSRLPRLRRLLPTFPDGVLDFVVWIAALSGFATAIAGWFLAQEGGYDADLLERHLWSGVVTGMGAFGCLILLSQSKARPERRNLRGLATALLVGTCGVMTVAAHAGGGLTHGTDFLTEYAPAPVRWVLGLHIPRDRASEPLTTIAEREAFDGVALRLFEDHCLECHNPGKTKGNLRLDTHEGVLAGGQSGPAVLPGDPGSSRLLQRIRLPLEDKKHMPPVGKEQPTADAVAVLTWWIEAGVPETDTLRILKAPPEIRLAFSRTLPEPERLAVEELQARLAAEYEATLASLRTSIPGALRPILPGERDLEYTAAIAGATFGDADLQELGAAGNDLVWLDLSRTGITDGGLAVLAKMPNLERLDLRGTSVGDDGLESLAGLEHLETLSLYGTAVTDAGLKAVQALPALRRLYLGGTQVTEEGLEALKSARGELHITR